MAHVCDLTLQRCQGAAQEPTNPTNEDANAILNAKAVRKLHEIKIVSPCPILSPTGEFIGSGFHDGVYVTADAAPVDLMSYDEAVDVVMSLIEHFQPETPADRSRIVAMILTPGLVLSGFFDDVNVPLMTLDADESQTGKTLLSKLIQRMYSVREVSPVTTRGPDGGVGSFDENLSQALAKGQPFIFIDNARGDLNSPLLETVMTSRTTVEVRLVHRGYAEINATRTTLQLTSSVLSMTTDLSNRMLNATILKRPEGYAFPTYPEGSFLEHVWKLRHWYLGAVYTILRHWIANDRPRTNQVEHDFREWAGSLDWIVQKMGLDPMLVGHRAKQRVVRSVESTFLATLTRAMLGDRDETQMYSTTDLLEAVREHRLPIPGGETTALGLGRVLGRLFQSAETVQDVDDQGRPLHESGTMFVDGKFACRMRHWSTEKGKFSPWEYSFRRTPEPGPGKN